MQRLNEMFFNIGNVVAHPEVQDNIVAAGQIKLVSLISGLAAAIFAVAALLTLPAHPFLSVLGLFVFLPVSVLSHDLFRVMEASEATDRSTWTKITSVVKEAAGNSVAEQLTKKTLVLCHFKDQITPYLNLRQ
jgi:hypothetical protein